MCTTCGCGSNGVTIQKIGDDQVIEYIPGNGHTHTHHHGRTSLAMAAKPGGGKTVLDLEVDVLRKNDLVAARNRQFFTEKNILSLNLVSSPGSGKTSILERTLADLKETLPFYVIEGDQQTSNDANRVAATGAPVVQINTGKGCHLDAEMVYKALRQLEPLENAVMMIENVGNLVCPAMFDLGESKRVVIISTTEGDDKPSKYPDMFHSAQLCLINKIDLLPYVRFDVEKAKSFALEVNPKLKFIEVSATTGQGMADWYAWLKEELGVKKV